MMEQISASIDKNTLKSVEALASKEKRSFSAMVAILLDEAVNVRVTKILDKMDNKTPKKNAPRHPSI